MRSERPSSEVNTTLVRPGSSDWKGGQKDSSPQLDLAIDRAKLHTQALLLMSGQRWKAYNRESPASVRAGHQWVGMI